MLRIQQSILCHASLKDYILCQPAAELLAAV
jgi:hypothetical protein